ncbi:unnamed protein product [Psylliodes chrysocephalus]|uniref:Uncharacterized protein n=1 Tax=Psylliodes chrysocephalus TaxID=3402493 RepID=A0A9P0G6V2_9CUCU|nr:unnamed protein product [Psylliodes chrysocephala]
MFPKNPRFVFSIVFCGFLIDFGVSWSDGSRHGEVTKRTVKNNKEEERGSRNQTDLTKNKSSHIIYQPFQFHLKTKTHVPTRSTKKLKGNAIPNQTAKKVPKKQIKIDRDTLTEQNQESIPNPSQKFGLDLNIGGSNGKKGKKNQQSFIQRILPLMVTPFLISSAMVPMMLMSLVHMLVKSAFIGKIGLILMIINMFSNRRNPGGVSHHSLDTGYAGNDVAMAHYGWHGDEEYGAYVNRKRRRK